MQKIRHYAHKLLQAFGYDIHKYRPTQVVPFGTEPIRDMQTLLCGKASPVIFDVGAHLGETARWFAHAFPGAQIHSFEPSPGTYQKCKEGCVGYNNVKTWNYGIGAKPSVLSFYENDHTDMSSFLKQGSTCWGKIEKVTDVEVVSLDAFATEHKIDFIDILKADTQGYEFEVFKGAHELMSENRIGVLFFEYIFYDQYQGIAPFHEVLKYLEENNFSLVCIYEQRIRNNVLAWTDMLFINNNYKQRL